MSALVSLFLILSCHRATIVPSSAIEAIPSPPESSLSSNMQQIMEPDSNSLSLDLRQSWANGWTHARAYAYNFKPPASNFKPIWTEESGWLTEGLVSEIALSTAEAEVALELVHRTGGGVRASKCLFAPRHSVVFFDDEDQPIAYMSLCFSCYDSDSWPKYFQSKEEDRRFEEMSRETEYPIPMLFTIHDEVMDKWLSYFDEVGVPNYPQAQ